MLAAELEPPPPRGARLACGLRAVGIVPAGMAFAAAERRESLTLLTSHFTQFGSRRQQDRMRILNRNF